MFACLWPGSPSCAGMIVRGQPSCVALEKSPLPRHDDGVPVAGMRYPCLALAGLSTRRAPPPGARFLDQGIRGGKTCESKGIYRSGPPLGRAGDNHFPPAGFHGSNKIPLIGALGPSCLVMTDQGERTRSDDQLNLCARFVRVARHDADDIMVSLAGAMGDEGVNIAPMCVVAFRMAGLGDNVTDLVVAFREGIGTPDAIGPDFCNSLRPGCFRHGNDGQGQAREHYLPCPFHRLAIPFLPVPASRSQENVNK